MNWIDLVVQSVAELDYNSPEGHPDVMLVTVNELRVILERCDHIMASHRDEVLVLELLKRAMTQLAQWTEFYGKHCNTAKMDNALPPSGGVRLAEDVAEFLMTNV